MGANRPEFPGRGDKVVRVDVHFPDAHQQIPELDQDDSVGEALAVSQIGPRRWRIEQNPIFSGAVAYGDIVQGDFDERGTLVVQRVAERSPLRKVHTLVPRMFYFSPAGKAFSDRLVELGGMWDMFAWGILVFSYPEDAHDEVSELFKKACDEAQAPGRTEKRSPVQLIREQSGGGRARRGKVN